MKKLLIPPVFVLISTILIATFYFVLPGWNLIPFPWNVSGAVVAFAGFAIMGTARELFKKHNTKLQFNKTTEIVTEGVYGRSRNPLYLGMFLILLGIGICFRNIFSVLPPFVFVIIIHLVFIPKEEKFLAETFGQAYLDYKKKVRRWI